MYTCNICNYETDVRTAIYNHNKTKKHLKNIKDYEKKNTEEKEIIEKQNKEIEELKKELIKVKQEKEIAKLEVEAKIYKELSEKAKNINQGIIINTNNNTNNLNYVNKHFKNAPPYTYYNEFFRIRNQKF